MGSGTLLSYSDPGVDVPAVVTSGRPADPELTMARLADVYPDATFELREHWTRGAIGAAAWPGVLLLDPYVGWLASHPDEVDPAWLTPGVDQRIAYVEYQSVVDAVSVVIWEPRNVLSRCILFADGEIQHSSGEPADFEVPFWSGEKNPVDPLGGHDYDADDPLPFWWTDFLDTACRSLFGVEIWDASDHLLWFDKS